MTVCEHCGKEFVPQRKTAKFCSDSCRRDFNRGKVGSLGLARAAEESVQGQKPQVEKQNEDVTKRMAAITKEMNERFKKAGLDIEIGSRPLELVSSGIKEIDEMTGGIPREMVTEIFGMKGVGKTYLMSKIISGMKDLSIFYVDVENAVTDVPNNVVRVHKFEIGDVKEAVDEALKSKKFDVIVVDSVAALVPRTEEEGGFIEAGVGTKARPMNKWMRLINQYLPGSRSALVFINQERENIGPYKAPFFTPGGRGLPYAASLRLRLSTTKADRIQGQTDKGKEFVGHWVNVEVEKSRICKPHQKTKFKLTYPEEDVPVQS